MRGAREAAGAESKQPEMSVRKKPVSQASSALKRALPVSFNGRYGVRTCDLFRVKEARYHCANRPGRDVGYIATPTLCQNDDGSVRSFLDRIAIPTRHLDDNVARAVGHALATQTRLQGQSRRFFELVQLFVGCFVAGFQTFADDDMAGGASAHTAASVFERDVESIADVEDRSGLSAAAVGDRFRAHDNTVFLAFDPKQ